MTLDDAARLRFELANRGAGAEERRHELARLPDLFAGDLAAVASVLERLFDHHEQCGEIDRLGQELIGARLNGSHRELDRSMAGQDDDRHVAIEILEGGDEMNRIPVGQVVVHDRQVNTDRLERDMGGGARVGFAHLEAGGHEVFAHALPDRRIVFDQKDVRPWLSVRFGCHVARPVYRPNRRNYASIAARKRSVTSFGSPFPLVSFMT